MRFRHVAAKSANSPRIVATTGDLGDNLARFRRSLRAENVSPNTILAYCGAVDRLVDFLVGSSLPTDVVAIRRDHLEAFIADALDRLKPATANHRFRGVQRFFNYLADEGVLATSPMVRMRPPRIPEDPPAVLTRAEQARLLAACEGAGFEARRDKAIVSVFLDTGVRRAEVAGLRWTPDNELTNDFDLDGRAIRVLGKGRRERLVRIGHKTVKDLDRYLTVRERHPHAHLASLWLGRRGALTDLGTRPDGPGAREGGRTGRKLPPPPAAAHIRPRVAEQRWQRGRPHEAGRLAIKSDAPAVCGVDRLGAGARGPRSPVAAGPPVASEGSITGFGRQRTSSRGAMPLYARDA